MVKRRFLFTVWEGGGTIPPELAIARQLRERGHEVAVLGDPCARDDVLSVGCEFFPYHLAPHRLSRAPESDLLREWEVFGHLGSFVRARDRLTFGPAYQFALDTLDVIERFRPDVIACDSMLLGTACAAERAGIPAAMVMPNIYIYPAPGIPPIGPGWQPGRGPFGRLRDKAAFQIHDRLIGTGLPALNEARERLGLPTLSKPLDMLYHVDRVLVLTSTAFDFPAHALPSHVRYVGPQLDDPGWVEPFDSPWPRNHPDPLVVVSFSTTYQAQGRAVQRTIAALGKLPVRGLVTIGPSLPLEEFAASSNVVVRRSAPHRHVFPLASLVVTHAGHGTLLKALATGLPVVCLPMGRDQNDNAARVVASGTGIRLSPRATVRSLRQAIERVLEDPSFKRQARRMAAHIKLEIQKPRGAIELESMAGVRERSDRRELELVGARSLRS